jgi:hypothetical protein
MERDDVSDSELVLLRVVLMQPLPLVRSVAQYADYTGLSISDTADAAARLAELGLIDWRRGGDYTAPWPRFEHELWPALAARVAATPIRWPEAMGVPRDPQLVRSDIDDDMSRYWSQLRQLRPDRFDCELEDDSRLAASVLRLGAWRYWDAEHLVEAAYLLSPAAWRSAAQCFADGSLRQVIGLSLADSRTLPGLPPMLVVDRQRMNCGVCFRPVRASEGRHTSCLDSQLGEGLLTTTIAPGGWADELPFEPGCGAVWTHYTLRAELAEMIDWIGPDGQMRKRMQPLDALPDLIWLDP